MLKQQCQGPKCLLVLEIITFCSVLKLNHKFFQQVKFKFFIQQRHKMWRFSQVWMMVYYIVDTKGKKMMFMFYNLAVVLLFRISWYNCSSSFLESESQKNCEQVGLFLKFETFNRTWPTSICHWLVKSSRDAKKSRL